MYIYCSIKNNVVILHRQSETYTLKIYDYERN